MLGPSRLACAAPCSLSDTAHSKHRATQVDQRGYLGLTFFAFVAATMPNTLLIISSGLRKREQATRCIKHPTRHGYSPHHNCWNLSACRRCWVHPAWLAQHHVLCQTQHTVSTGQHR